MFLDLEAHRMIRYNIYLDSTLTFSTASSSDCLTAVTLITLRVASSPKIFDCGQTCCFNSKHSSGKKNSNWKCFGESFFLNMWKYSLLRIIVWNFHQLFTSIGQSWPQPTIFRYGVDWMKIEVLGNVDSPNVFAAIQNKINWVDVFHTLIFRDLFLPPRF